MNKLDEKLKTDVRGVFILLNQLQSKNPALVKYRAKFGWIQSVLQRVVNVAVSNEDRIRLERSSAYATGVLHSLIVFTVFSLAVYFIRRG